MERKLWYRQPAQKWVEALPLGNGRIGAMVFGGAEREVFSLNEDTLWSGIPDDRNEPGRWKQYKIARKLVMEHRFEEAQEILRQQLCGEFGEAYMSLGDLTIQQTLPCKPKDYARKLSLEEAVHTVDFSCGDISYSRTSFVSAPRQALYVQYESGKPASVSLGISMSSPLRNTVCVSENSIVLDVICPSHAEPSYENSPNPIQYSDNQHCEGIRARAILTVRQEGGCLSIRDNHIYVSSADRVEIVFCVRSNFAGWNVFPADSSVPFEQRVKSDCVHALDISFSKAREEHIRDYQHYFGRVQLLLTGPENAAALPTDERLRKFAEDSRDTDLFALLFDYGRYLMISGSRPGTQPLNLQGIWNDSLVPPWSSNYTTNINTEMNYWPALACNLREMQQPLDRMISELREAGRTTAKEYYNARGFVAHHNLDIWRHTNPVGRHKKGCCTYGFWPLGSGWLCRHLFEEFEYTHDMFFLRNTVYPVLHDACEFYLDVLITDEYGYRIFAPSTSPENNFLVDGRPVSTAQTATMTVSILRELFESCAACCDLLDIDADFACTLREELQHMPPLRIGSDGRLLEWNEEFPEHTPENRHVSHLYALYPANEISPRRTPELAQACKRTLVRRTDEGTGWSLAWKINFWARLGDGDHALALLKRQLRVIDTTDMSCRYSGGGTYLNLFDAHPPFQIDGNFGACAGIAQMLVQNDGDALLLLPALPHEWSDGSVSGLCAKHGVEISLKWKNGCLTSVCLTSQFDRAQTVIYGEKHFEVQLIRGQSIDLLVSET